MLCAKLLGLSLLGTLAALGCSSDPAAVNSPPFVPSPAPTGQGFDGGAEQDATVESGAIPIDAYMGTGAQPVPNFGDIPVVDVPSAPCVKSEGSPVTVVDAKQPTGTGFQRMGIVGTRRFAFGPDSRVLMTFGADGSAPSEVVSGVVSVAASGDRVYALHKGPDSLDLQAYDAMGKPVDGRRPLVRSAVDGASLAIGVGQLLAIWREDGVIRGVVTPTDAGPLTPVDLGMLSGGSGECQTAAVWNGEEYSLVWSRGIADGTTKTTWIHISKTGTWLYAKPLFTSREPHYLFDVVKTSTGIALLLGQGRWPKAGVVYRVDDWGYPVGPAHRLLGSRVLWSLAPLGNEHAVVASLEDGRAGFRSFDVSGAPLGPWVCMDDGEPNSTFYSQAAVGMESHGYGVVARMADGSTSYRKVDRVGLRKP